MAGPQFPLAVVLSAVDRLTGPLGRVEGRLQSFGKSLSRIGRNLTLSVTAPALALGTAVLTSSARFEEGMLRVQALTGRTADELQEAEAQARTLGSTTVFTATQAADAMGNLALAGFQVNEITSATPPILSLATAASSDLAESAEIAAGALRSYGFEADQTQRVSDVLTRTFTTSATRLEDLGEAMTVSAPVARTMGIEFEELAASLGLLGNRMFRGTMAGTAIRGALAKLANPSREAAAVLAKLEIPLDSLLDARGNVRSLTNTIRQLEDAGATAGDLLAIFGQRAGPAMAALVSSGASALEDMTADLRDSTGTAARIAAVRMEGAAGGVRALKSAFEGLTIAIGQSGLLQWFTDAVRGLTEWFQGLSQTNPELLRTATVVGLVAAALGPFLVVAGSAVTAIGGLVTATTALGGALTFLAANPIGVAILSLGALVAGATLLVTQWDRIVAGSKAVALWIGDKLSSAFDFLTRQVQSLIDLVPDWLVDVVTGAGGAVADFLGFGDGGAAGPGIARGAALAGARTTETILREDKSKRTRLEVDFTNLPPGAIVRPAEGDPLEDVELGVTLAPG